MHKNVRSIGLDVHAESIVMAVADPGQTPAQVCKSIPYDLPRLLKELRQLGARATLSVCYEAGPTGLGVQRFLQQQQIDCIVVAPSLVPVQSGSRVKTDRRDACKLAHFLRSGDLTPIWIPDAQTEALRDLERAREDARLALRRARQQLLKFLLRHDCRYTEGVSHGTQTHWRWIRRQRFELEPLNRVLADYVRAVEQSQERMQQLTQDLAELVEGWALAELVKNLQAFLGVQLVTAVGLAAEIGNFQRFEKAGPFMAFVGLVPSEHSSGGSRKQGGITKTGNRHVRRRLIEAAWHDYNAQPGVSQALAQRREGVPEEIVTIAEKARRRLMRKAFRMRAGKKSPNKIATALARELAGFVWAAARESTCVPALETQPRPRPSARAQGGQSLCRKKRKAAPVVG